MFWSILCCYVVSASVSARDYDLIQYGYNTIQYNMILCRLFGGSLRTTLRYSASRASATSEPFFLVSLDIKAILYIYIYIYIYNGACEDLYT